MIISDLRQAIVDTINDTINDQNNPEAVINTAKTHPGRFNQEELSRMAAGRLPQVLVAIINAPAIKPGDNEQAEISLRFAAFIITADMPTLPKDIGALNLVEAVGAIVPNNRWGQTGKRLSTPQNISAENLYSGTLDNIGVAVWAITWNQSIYAGADAFKDPILLKELYVTCNPDYFGNAPKYTKVTP